MIDGVWTAYSKKTTHMMKPLSAQNKKKMPPVVPRGEQPHRAKVIGKGSIDISTLNVKIEKEGETVTVEEGFDAHKVSLVGKVEGDPPFTGQLRHHGWLLEKDELPDLGAPTVLLPAEVELT